MQRDIRFIVKQFQIGGELAEARPYGSGHINDTYVVICNHNGECVRYILQKINHYVFKDPAGLMENIMRVTEHIHNKLKSEKTSDLSRRVMTVISTKDDRSYYKDSEGNFWRLYTFIENARTFDLPESLDHIYEAARAFGVFEKMLLDLPGPPLHETIAGFHNGPERFRTFKQAVEDDVCNRAEGVKNEIEFLLKNGWIFDVSPQLVESGRIPVRITHNDTKINNVMIDDKSGKGLCVIDLDTVMSGLSLYDFGDIMRTTVTSASEAERDLSKVQVEMSRFEAVVKGYLSAAGEFLNEAERDNLVHGAKMMSLIMGTRFLTDYLLGDRYYKIDFESHNLDRCRTQLKLFESVTEQQERMNAIVEKVFKEDISI